MAKQSGIHQLKGKVRGMSYYRQKGVVDGLARSINQGLSKRVKEDAGYQNTRLNAAEFGTAGSFAGAAIRAISDRQRAMLKDFATGAFAKVVKAFILQDTTHPWGSRQLIGAQGSGVLTDAINSYAKNDFASYVGGVWDGTIGDVESKNTFTPNAELPQGWGGLFASKGATGAYISMYAYLVTLDQNGDAPFRSWSICELVGEEDAAIGTEVSMKTPATISDAFDVTILDNQMLRTLVVVRPYKEVNSKKYIMQELCTFALFTPTEDLR